MSKTIFKAVIGKNFGDEGKGLATDFLCLQGTKNLVVRANGGAQSGHTVEVGTKRFVFHELSSGSFRHADTYWAETYHPDLYKLAEEMEDFKAVSGFVPKIFAAKNAGITTILDVILNMAFETGRGADRHGSCGMGIYETELREQAGYKITVGDVIKLGEEGLANQLFDIREYYSKKRLKEEKLTHDLITEYLDLLDDDNVVTNYAKTVCNNIKPVEVIDSESKLFKMYDQVIFENGQGLLLDAECERFMPNVTGSRTGLVNVAKILENKGFSLDEAVYVSRSYVTRHGAGELPCEFEAPKIPGLITDVTNIPNKWQGKLRFAPHESVSEFAGAVSEDLLSVSERPKVSLLLTHLNETDGRVIFDGFEMTPETLKADERIGKIFDNVYLSYDRFAENIKKG